MVNSRIGENNPMFGKKHSLKTRLKMSKSHSIKFMYPWKGDYAGEKAIHIWVRKNKPVPKICPKCGLKHQKIEAANVDHKYNRNLDDYIYLCSKCHDKYDRENGLRYKKKVLV